MNGKSGITIKGAQELNVGIDKVNKQNILGIVLIVAAVLFDINCQKALFLVIIIVLKTCFI